MEKLKNKKIIIPIILLVLVIALGLTYAWFVWTDNGGETVKIKGGSLALRLDESSGNGVRLIRSIPMSDEQGLATAAYTFSVENRGSMNAKYSLSLENLDLDSEEGELVRMNDSNIRYSITRNGSDENPQALISRTIESNVIVNAGKTDTYTLKVWIQSEATREIAEQVFKARIKLDAVETEESAVPAVNLHIKEVYRYTEGTGTGANYTGCLGGEEAGCVNIASSVNKDTKYNAGDIIKYEVSDGVYKYFNVLYDNGTTLTLQQRENTVDSKPWNVWGNEKGPAITSGFALYELEQATSSWSYVKDQTYQIGVDTFGTGSYASTKTGCTVSIGSEPNSNNCTTMQYQTLTRSNVKARMITAQEAGEMSCKMGTSNSCKKFMNNYLFDATTYGGSYTRANYGYWTMSAYANESNFVLEVHCNGSVNNPISDGSTSIYGARAVVEINK